MPSGHLFKVGTAIYFHWGCLPSSNSEEIWDAKKISLYGRERHPVRQITDLRQSAYFVMIAGM